MRAEGEAEAAVIISKALAKAGDGLVQFRRIEASKEIAATLAKVRAAPSADARTATTKQLLTLCSSSPGPQRHVPSRWWQRPPVRQRQLNLKTAHHPRRDILYTMRDGDGIENNTNTLPPHTSGRSSVRFGSLGIAASGEGSHR